ncbi:hypothetical protein FHW92_005038 [Novosphingobium sp. SG707]|nr:hypothetical protein [Novosphingobium sp. SG707]
MSCLEAGMVSFGKSSRSNASPERLKLVPNCRCRMVADAALNSDIPTGCCFA